MNEEQITIVTGLPRTGTSMMMNMLEKGGIEPLTDDERGPNIDNPKGYYEFERVKNLPEDTGWLDDAKGKAVKVLAELVKHLPEDYEYNVIFMRRKLEEVVESQKKMLERRGEDPDKVSDQELMDMFSQYLNILEKEVHQHSNMHVLYVKYNDVVNEPRESVEEINEFFERELDTGKMASVVDEDLYRNRA